MKPDFLGKLDLVQARALIDADATGVPERIGRFVVERSLGAGATGIVYLASDPALQRKVVLKVLAPSLGVDPAAVRRFEAEARIASALEHPRIAMVHDIGRDATGLVYIAMAYREGRTLRDRLRQGPMPIAEALRIGAEIAEGLAAAHAAGVVHRDVKPENVLLTARGACLLDFGIATVVSADGAPPGAFGTPAYMSPEQARGEPLDARTDLWALGTVLHEMLTGRRPFAAASDEALLRAVLHDEPLPPSTVRAGVPAAADQLVRSLLAKRPAERPASAEAVRARLLALAGDGRGRDRSRRAPWLVIGLVALTVLAGTLFVRRRTAPPRRALGDPDLLAVAPFDVLDPSLQTWREGVVDLLSRDLDGAGPLRSVSQSVALPQWEGRGDPESAERYGQRLGAGLVVFGTVVRVGADSVLLRASVLDRAHGNVQRDLEVAGVEARMGRLTDSLALVVLAALGRERPITSSRQLPMGARNLPALKAFLRAEQLYRRHEWDSAAAYYDAAASLDTTFGLALRRLSTVLDWGIPSASRYASSARYFSRALALGYGPSPREQKQHAADSLGWLMTDRRDPELLLAADHGQMQGYLDLVARYPDDPVLWTQLGELQYHPSGAAGRDPASARRSFARAIALDSGFTPAYEHAFGLALWARDPAEARRLGRAYVARAQSVTEPRIIALSLLLMDHADRADVVDSALRASAARTLVNAGGDALQWLTDSAESAALVLGAFAAGRFDPARAATFLPRADAPQWHAHALAFRGHLRAAATIAAPNMRAASERAAVALRDPFVDLALLGALPDTLVRRTFAQGLAGDSAWESGSGAPRRHLLGLPWWYLHGDTVSIARFGRLAADVARRSDSARALLRGRYLAPAADAWLALARGDTAHAVATFRGIPDALCATGDCHFEKVKLAELLAARGKDSAAAVLLDRWGDQRGPTPSAVLARLLRGHIAERLGDRETAARCYRFVVEAWREPDAVLRPHVDSARAGLARVAAGPAT